MSPLVPVIQGQPGGDAGFGSPVPPEFMMRAMERAAASGNKGSSRRRRRRDIQTDMVADEPEQNVFDMPPSPTLGMCITVLV